MNNAVLNDAVNDIIHLSISDDSYEIDPHHQPEDTIDEGNNMLQVAIQYFLG